MTSNNVSSNHSSDVHGAFQAEIEAETERSVRDRGETEALVNVSSETERSSRDRGHSVRGEASRPGLIIVLRYNWPSLCSVLTRPVARICLTFISAITEITNKKVFYTPQLPVLVFACLRLGCIFANQYDMHNRLHQSVCHL